MTSTPNEPEAPDTDVVDPEALDRATADEVYQPVEDELAEG